MSDEVTEGTEAATESGLSRRNALRAGVAVGVGAVAWSGVTITSLGGTPAYAQTTSGVIIVDLNANSRCRNIDVGQGQPPCSPGSYRYHELRSSITVEGFTFTVSPNITEGTCCEAGATATFNYDASSLTCRVQIDIWEGQVACDRGRPLFTPKASSPLFATPGSGSIIIDFDCFFPAVQNDRYSVTAVCTPI